MTELGGKRKCEWKKKTFFLLVQNCRSRSTTVSSLRVPHSMPAPSFVACTLCYKGSKKPRGHQGKHKTTKTTKSKKKRLARGQSECTECAPRSGNPEGHRGRHKGSTHPRKTPAQSRALKRKRESVAAQRAQTGPCTKCCDGAGKESGHRGRHATVISEKKRKVLRSECEACFVGSGKEQGHRGAFA